MLFESSFYLVMCSSVTASGVHLFSHANLEYPLKMYYTITSYLLIKCAVLLHVLHYVLYNSLITQCIICTKIMFFAFVYLSGLQCISHRKKTHISVSEL